MNDARLAGRGAVASAVTQTGKAASVAHTIRRCLLAAAALWLVITPAQAQTQVANTRHNFTPAGVGAVRSSQATGTCLFCHVSHDAAPVRAQWSGPGTGTTYRIYASSSMQARVDQPTGSSRLCLSCHDGVLAVSIPAGGGRGGRVVSAPLKGSSVLGTDLSSNHPVSFVYDSALALRRGELADPASLPSSIHLDQNRQMQCTTCHDAHEDRQVKFLRMDNRAGALCTACHRPRHWGASAHATSMAGWKGSGKNPLPAEGPSSVADSGCLGCHRPHAGVRSQFLLAQAGESDNCTSCHGTAVARKNIEQEFLKPLHHPIESGQWSHQPHENPLGMVRHVSCADCHNGHSATSAPGSAPVVSGSLLGVPGLSLDGAPVSESSFEHEVCNKCHGVQEPATFGIARQGGTRNIRLKIQPANPSFHPIAVSGNNPGMLGLQPGYSPSSVIYCSSCHNNDDWTATGSAPAGPHGSRYEPILERQYITQDPTPESAQSYAMCYKCHNRSFLIGDGAHSFPHQRHVVGDQAPCAVCHDAHGSRQNAHLVDFMLRDRSGKAVVTRSAQQGRLEYRSLGPGRGQCWLQCHGVNHEPKSYP